MAAHVERERSGVILADEIGLGNTLQALALMKFSLVSGLTLIVAPANLVVIWIEEIERFLEISGDEILYYKGQKSLDVEELAQFTVVITSYYYNRSQVSSMADAAEQYRYKRPNAAEIWRPKNRSNKATAALMKLNRITLDSSFTLFVDQ
jgi:hypothetical protein